MNKDEDLGFTFTSASAVSDEEYGFTFTPSNEVKEKNAYVEKAKDYGKTALKGTVEGITQFGRMMSGTQLGEEVTPEVQTERLNEMFPLEGEEDYGQRALRRGLKMAPSAMAFPGSALEALPRSIAAGFMGEGAKDLGLPEWAQTAAEITAFIGPDVTKKLIEKGSNKEIIAAAKELGISDEALTPLLQSDFKTKWLSKLTPRRGALQSKLAKSHKEVSNAYSSLTASEEALGQIKPEANKKLMEDMGKKLFNMPAGVRNKIQEDFQDLIKAPITGESLMNFYADVNHYYPENAKQLGLLKGPIKEAISSISPQLGKDFELVNTLLHKHHKIAATLKPNLKTDIMEASEALGTLFGVVTGNYSLMYKVAGERTTRQVAQMMLTNPRFQQIGQKTVEAMNSNKPAVVMKLTELLAHEMEDVSPELADQLRNVTGFELKKLLSQEKEDKE